MSIIKKFKHQQPSDDVIINNLQQLMFSRRLNEAELSRQTGIAQATLHKIFSGKTADPRISTLKLLADFFGITLDDLYLKDILDKKRTAQHGQSVPIISWADCINSANPIAKLTPTSWEKWIVIEQTNNEYIYALASKPSMEPRFPRGTILIVNPKALSMDGDLVVVQYPDTNEAALRELSIDGPNKLLLPLNVNSVPDKLENNIKIIGTIIQSRFFHHQ
jgi:SOS-response transcriptional repressor LexA